MSVGVMIAPPGHPGSCLPRPRPGAIDLADLRARLSLRRVVERERLAIRLPCRADAAVWRARHLFDVKESHGVDPGRRGPHVGKLAAGAAEGLDQREVGAVWRESEVVIVLVGIEASTRHRSQGCNDAVASSTQQVE